MKHIALISCILLLFFAFGTSQETIQWDYVIKEGEKTVQHYLKEAKANLEKDCYRAAVNATYSLSKNGKKRQVNRGKEYLITALLCLTKEVDNRLKEAKELYEKDTLDEPESEKVLEMTSVFKGIKYLDSLYQRLPAVNQVQQTYKFQDRPDEYDGSFKEARSKAADFYYQTAKKRITGEDVPKEYYRDAVANFYKIIYLIENHKDTEELLKATLPKATTYLVVENVNNLTKKNGFSRTVIKKTILENWKIDTIKDVSKGLFGMKTYSYLVVNEPFYFFKVISSDEQRSNPEQRSDIKLMVEIADVNLVQIAATFNIKTVQDTIKEKDENKKEIKIPIEYKELTHKKECHTTVYVDCIFEKINLNEKTYWPIINFSHREAWPITWKTYEGEGDTNQKYMPKNELEPPYPTESEAIQSLNVPIGRRVGYEIREKAKKVAPNLSN